MGKPSKEEPVIEGEFKLQRFNAKGGWTYISIPPPPSATTKCFGMLRVKGKIDHHFA
ncbi:MAG: DUF1905 domain-containing protein [Chitinophagaceae bacterium]|nr:MAG: DUF1905 domain-containing protein [Chitinophagaceae bacterium]